MMELSRSAVWYYERAQFSVSRQTNACVIGMYWELGKAITERKGERSQAFYRQLSRDMQQAAPKAKLLTESSLRFAAQFYAVYQQAVAANDCLMRDLKRLTWLHHRMILQHCRNETDKAINLVRCVISRQWGTETLKRVLDGKAVDVELINKCTLDDEMMCNSHNLEYLGIRKEHNEKCVKEALKSKVVRALLEEKQGWAFVGRDICLPVGKTELWLDLLFYHLKRSCYVVVSVSPAAFDFGSWGLLGTQVAAVNHRLREKGRDGESQGMFVCRSKDECWVQYALETGSQHMRVSVFDGAAFLPEEAPGYAPSIEELESRY